MGVVLQEAQGYPQIAIFSPLEVIRYEDEEV